MPATREQRRAAAKHVRTFPWECGLRFPAHGMCFTMEFGHTVHLPVDTQEAIAELKEAIRIACGGGYLPTAIMGLGAAHPSLVGISDGQCSTIRRWWLRAWEETGVAKTREHWLAEEQARKEARTARKAAKQAEAVLTPQI